MTLKKIKNKLTKQLKPTGAPLPVRAMLARKIVQIGGKETGLAHIAWLSREEVNEVFTLIEEWDEPWGSHDPQRRIVAITGPKGSVIVEA